MLRNERAAPDADTSDIPVSSSREQNNADLREWFKNTLGIRTTNPSLTSLAKDITESPDQSQLNEV